MITYLKKLDRWASRFMPMWLINNIVAIAFAFLIVGFMCVLVSFIRWDYVAFTSITARAFVVATYLSFLAILNKD